MISLLGKEVIYREIDINVYFAREEVENLAFNGENIYYEIDKARELIKEIDFCEQEIKLYKSISEEVDGILNSASKELQTEHYDGFDGSYVGKTANDFEASDGFKIQFYIEKLFESEFINLRSNCIEQARITETEYLMSSIDNVKDFVSDKIKSNIQKQVNSYEQNIVNNRNELVGFLRKIGVGVNDQISIEELKELVAKTNDKLKVSHEGYSLNAVDVETLVEYTSDYNDEYYAQHPGVDEEFLAALQQKYFQNLGIISSEGKSKR